MPRETIERKTVRSRALKIDEVQGIVEHIVAVCGNVDLGDDRIKSGAFTKTIVEQGQKVRVLDQHRTDTIMAALGRALSLREIGRSELPDDVREDYPEATGALVAVTQYLMDTPEGKGAFIRIAEGAVDEYSIGYEALDSNYETVKVHGKDRTVRNLTTIRLWEYGPVLWGMNEATQTIGVKDGGAPPEEKPWDVFEIDGEFCVYKIDADGARTGETLGCHAEQEDANDQLRALYANEAAAKGPDAAKGSPHIAAGKTGASDTLGSSTADGKELNSEGWPVQRLGDVISGMIHKVFTMMCDSWLVEGILTQEERIPLSGLIGDALDLLSAGLPEELAQRTVYWYSSMSATAPSAQPKAALKKPEATGAGPATPPTSVNLDGIEAELREIEFMEVTL